MKLISTVLMIASFAAAPVAFADAYVRCANPNGFAFSVSPTQVNGSFTGDTDLIIRLPANDPDLKKLGLNPDEDYEFRTTLKNCSNDPNFVFVSSCFDMKAAPATITLSILGLRDHDFRTLELQSIGVKSERIQTIQEGFQSDQVRVRAVLSGMKDGAPLTDVINLYFEIPLPELIPTAPGQCG